MRVTSLILALAVLVVMALTASPAGAGAFPKQIRVHRGNTPTLDGRISPGEYADATKIVDFSTWAPQFSTVDSNADLDATVWIKHDGTDLYVAFDVNDDVIYAFDTQRWLPPNNDKAHELTREGWPWFGDGAELLVNARYSWSDEDGENNKGNGSSWQMVASTHKSRLGGLGTGGLMEGEQRSDENAWNTYQRWILNGDMEAVSRVKDRASEGPGYIIEWKVKSTPCLEVEPGVFWSPALGEVKMGLNLAIADIDEPERGAGNFGNFHHEQWWTGERDKRTWLKQWGTMILVPGSAPEIVDPNPPGTLQLTPVVDLPLREVVVQVPEAFREDVPPNMTVNLPAGFSAKIFAAPGLHGPRFMAIGPRGVLHVANMKAGGASQFRPTVDTDTPPPIAQRYGQIVALPDGDGDGAADSVRVVADGLWWANSLAFHDGDLYVADTHEILRFSDGDGDGIYETRHVLIPGIPTRGQHITRTLAIDSLAGKLYVSVGSTCDVCREDDSERATILQFNLDGSGRRIFARGLRNAVGLAVHPQTGDLWANSNGHDREGRMLPPEPITIIRDGGFYGWPLAYGYGIWTDTGISNYANALFPITAQDSADVASMVRPVALAPAHLAPMQMHFYQRGAFADLYHGATFVAFRGGSNANVRGMKVSALFTTPDGRDARMADFLTGFQPNIATGSGSWARPVGVVADGRGLLYVSSDGVNNFILKILPSALEAHFEQAPPEHISSGTPLRLRATVEVSGLVDGTPVEAVADLSALGGSRAHQLIRVGDNRYRLEADLDVPRGGELPILVSISQRIVGEIISVQLRHVIVVVPGNDLKIASEILAPGWHLEGDNTVRLEGFSDSVPDYEGKALVATATDVGFRGWGITFTPDSPVNPSGYRSLRFALNPGTLTAPVPFLTLRVAPAANIDLLDGHIDLGRAEWQTVELHFEDMVIGSSQNSVLITKQGLDEPIESIHLQGNLEGTFYLDEMHLVSLVQEPPVTAVVEESLSIPDRFILEQSFPNPFNSSTTLRFTLPAPSPVELSVYNLSGQRVVTLVDEMRDQGAHQIRWDGMDAAGRDVATGMYIYRMATGGHVQTRKLLLLR
jgi:glucose/arabinose dehydrogenase